MNCFNVIFVFEKNFGFDAPKYVFQVFCVLLLSTHFPDFKIKVLPNSVSLFENSKTLFETVKLSNVSVLVRSIIS